jgi:hypothetical protein
MVPVLPMVALMVSLAAPCEAALLRYEFTGHISLIRGRLPGDGDFVAGSAALDAITPFTIGTTFTGSFMYDTSTTDTSADPMTGIYDGPLPDDSVVWNIGGPTFTGGLGRYDVRVLDRDATTGDLFVVDWGRVFGTRLGPPVLPAGWELAKSPSAAGSVYHLRVDFYDRTDRTALTSDALPNPFVFSEFDFGNVSFSTDAFTFQPITVTTPLGSVELEDLVLQGRIDTVTAAPVAVIPEPSSVVLLGIGCIGLIGYRQFRRKRQ